MINPSASRVYQEREADLKLLYFRKWLQEAGLPDHLVAALLTEEEATQENRRRCATKRRK
jgi:hypothetical protein